MYHQANSDICREGLQHRNGLIGSNSAASSIGVTSAIALTGPRSCHLVLWSAIRKRSTRTHSRQTVELPLACKLQRYRLGSDHIGSCTLIDTFRHHLLEHDLNEAVVPRQNSEPLLNHAVTAPVLSAGSADSRRMIRPAGRDRILGEGQLQLHLRPQ
jgi:hypothetical protein